MVKKQRYIQIPGTELNIDIEPGEETDYFRHHFLNFERGRTMATPYHFLTHLQNSRDAAEGRTELLDQNGKPFSKREATRIYETISGESGGFGIFLNGLYMVGENHSGLDVVIAQSTKKPKGLLFKRERLLKHVECNGEMAVLSSMNSQGYFQKFAERDQDYVRGEHVYFIQPLEDSVAGFVADSRGADLYCNWDPQNSDAELAVGPQPSRARRAKIRREK
jgi:hypothetical protein